MPIETEKELINERGIAKIEKFVATVMIDVVVEDEEIKGKLIKGDKCVGVVTPTVTYETYIDS